MMRPIIWPKFNVCLVSASTPNEFALLEPNLRNIHDIVALARHHQPILQHSILSWLLSPETAAERLRDANLAIYGLYVRGHLAGFGLLRAFQTDLVIEGAFVCTAPHFMREGVARDIIHAVTMVSDLTPAVLFYADAVSSHPMSQRALESVGCIPVGILPNFEKFGTDQSEFGPNETLIRYVRFPHNDAGRWLDRMELARLTPLALELLTIIRNRLDEHKGDDEDPEQSLKLVG